MGCRFRGPTVNPVGLFFWDRQQQKLSNQNVSRRTPSDRLFYGCTRAYRPSDTSSLAFHSPTISSSDTHASAAATPLPERLPSSVSPRQQQPGLERFSAGAREGFPSSSRTVSGWITHGGKAIFSNADWTSKATSPGSVLLTTWSSASFPLGFLLDTTDGPGLYALQKRGDIRAFSMPPIFCDDNDPAVSMRKNRDHWGRFLMESQYREFRRFGTPAALGGSRSGAEILPNPRFPGFLFAGAGLSSFFLGFLLVAAAIASLSVATFSLNKKAASCLLRRKEAPPFSCADPSVLQAASVCGQDKIRHRRSRPGRRRKKEKERRSFWQYPPA